MGKVPSGRSLRPRSREVGGTRAESEGSPREHPVLPRPIVGEFGFGAVLLLVWRTIRSSGAPRPAVAGAAPAPVAN